MPKPSSRNRMVRNFSMRNALCPHSMSVRFKLVIMLESSVSNRFPAMCQK